MERLSLRKNGPTNAISLHTTHQKDDGFQGSERAVKTYSSQRIKFHGKPGTVNVLEVSFSSPPPHDKSIEILQACARALYLRRDRESFSRHLELGLSQLPNWKSIYEKQLYWVIKSPLELFTFGSWCHRVYYSLNTRVYDLCAKLPYRTRWNQWERWIMTPKRGRLEQYLSRDLELSIPFRLFALRTWFLERNNFTYASHRNDLNIVGHYTQMVWAGEAHLSAFDSNFFFNFWNSSASHKVGCGLAKCARGGPRNKPFFNYVCNYCPMWVCFVNWKCKSWTSKSRRA